MAEENTPQDAAYSDEEFGSEHESDGDYEEFADEDAEIQEKPAEADTEDAGDYDAEFNEDGSVEIAAGSPPSETARSPIERLPTDADDESQEDAEPYDGEFDEDTPVIDEVTPVVNAGPPTEEKSEAVIEQTPSAADMTQNEVILKLLNLKGKTPRIDPATRQAIMMWMNLPRTDVARQKLYSKKLVHYLSYNKKRASPTLQHPNNKVFHQAHKQETPQQKLQNR
ncbi:hypothetical protein PR001_g3019 [Phytophthora rubi]|uniref:Uncharacterized protein n=1 Tax=Phytophthora rubi TaxID=129364 RepID=A0A6A3P3E8_9STRA|nr:hypothetical protein PR001_g3019 [Phytophthora rubi]